MEQPFDNYGLQAELIHKNTHKTNRLLPKYLKEKNFGLFLSARTFFPSSKKLTPNCRNSRLYTTESKPERKFYVRSFKAPSLKVIK